VRFQDASATFNGIVFAVGIGFANRPNSIIQSIENATDSFSAGNMGCKLRIFEQFSSDC
jgi:hypothetical protein